MRADVARFWSKVKKTKDCWIWQGCPTSKGYGRFWPTHNSGIHAHRFAWIITHGDLDEEIVVCHKCDNRICVNPEHLFVGSQIDNIRDMDAKGRRKPACGIQHGRSKITEQTVMNIRQDFEDGMRHCDIARKYGISHGTSMDIVKRRTWRHI